MLIRGEPRSESQKCDLSYYLMRLNLGCGDDRRAGYVNIDLRPEVCDVVADVRKLPYDNDSVDGILASDVLEHLPPADTVSALQEWHRVLVPAGSLTLRLPNLLLLAKMIVARTEMGRHHIVPLLIRNIYGGHRWGPDGEWDCHHTGWTPELLHNLLGSVGFDVVDNDGALNMTVVAHKR